MFAIKLRAPAKLNLGLRITGVRADGYHEIESLFVPVTIFDELEITVANQSTGNGQPAAGDRVVFIGAHGEVLPIFNDTISKALKLFRENVAAIPTFNVVVRKNIPTEAGMGGGSSDAGTVLNFLRGEYAPDFDNAGLNELALRIGADVPFFVTATPARVSGMGEKIEPIEIEPMAFLVVRPPFGVSTKEAYKWWDEAHPNPPKTSASSRTAKKTSLLEIVKNLSNDFELPVIARHPEIGVIKQALISEGALGALMSGSGSSTYGIFINMNDAEAAKARVQKRLPAGAELFVCEVSR